MDVDRIREQVKAFRVDGGYEQGPEDCFPAWYLHRRHHLSPSEAMAQSSDPAVSGAEKGYDFGVDAFHVDRSDSRPRLVVLQAKYSTDLAAVKKGFRDLEKAPETLHRMLSGLDADANRENKVLVNLRRALNQLTDEERKGLVLEFLVLHLCQDDPEVVSAATKSVQERLGEEIERHMEDRVFVVAQVGPTRLDFDRGADAGVVRVPSAWTPLTLAGADLEIPHESGAVRLRHGIGRLSELVEMYVNRRDELFAKNVRYFIKKASNTERGPAAKIRETLTAICVKKTLSPEIFALFHNGVTVFARGVRLSETGIEVQQPFVLNGCQTIKSAYLFLNDSKLRPRIDRSLWERLTVPLRVATTRDEELVHAITINTNRQNAMSPAALRANDRTQLTLQERFRSARLFYERQEGAMAHVFDTAPESLDEDYENTNNLPIRIVDLARSLAAAMGEAGLEWAHHPNLIFEQDRIYEKVFAEGNLRSIVFLTFLQNVHDMLGVVLKKDLPLAREDSRKAPAPARILYHALALLVRYLAKHGRAEFVLEFGSSRLGKKEGGFREELRKEMDRRSWIRMALKEHFMTLEDTKAESLRAAYVAAQKALGLQKEIDPFEVFGDLDDRRDEREA
ncbi:MAG: hypothetical protein EDX89_16515 [Acidobacteria bacterium]|nr:MAG: hypothetical protein EDX89_16515 [Acidobacteriota bacterium]MCE7957230.1 hypothetical protein [Acidobacteria bacterium ACB2]